MLTFETEGLIPLDAFSTFGMSAKPGSLNPLGKFGTGLKYSVAGILRLGGTFKLWRGLEEYEFYTSDVDFRGKTFAKVRMRKRKGPLARWRYEALPFTTELGKHWKPWMLMRELEANTRDEDGVSHINRPAQPRADCSVIEVACPEVEEAYDQLESVFMNPARKPIFEDDCVAIYSGEADYVFYRGMRVTDLRKSSLYTYEMKSVTLTEDRTSMYSFIDDIHMMRTLLACDDDEIVRNIVNNSEGHHESTFNWDGKAPSVSVSWRAALSSPGITGRFSTLRDNLDYGIAAMDDVEVTLEAKQWETVIGYMWECVPEDADIRISIEKQLTEAGWKS